MGNYRNLEIDFVERTLKLISQYEIIMHNYEFNKQFNHTLLINCLLGLIVFPKEISIRYIPNERLLSKLKSEMGITNSVFNAEIIGLRELIIALRHSIAHFDISFESNNEDFLIDRIVFRDKEKNENYIIASFVPNELLYFIRYYSTWLISNLHEHRE